MLVLHLGMRDGAAYAWAEGPRAADSAAPTGALPGGPGRALLASALRAAGLESRASRTFRKDMNVWLPTKAGAPLPSSPLLGEPPSSRAKAKLAPWTVTTRALSPSETALLLCACADRRTLGSGVVLGAEFAYWVEALRFAGALVARESFLPGLARRRGEHRAVWEPVIAGADVPRLAKLTEAMPPVTRALTESGAAQAPETPAAEVLSDFLIACVDHLVRSSLDDALRRRSPSSRRSGGADSLHSAWLDALRSADGRITGSQADLEALGRQIEEWRRPLRAVADASFRLCFRLEEPAPDDDADQSAAEAAWNLRYLLQPHSDPSLLISLERALAPDALSDAEVSRLGPRAREDALSLVGQASAISPSVESGLRTAVPSSHPMDAASAHRFMTEEAIALTEAGFGVLLPSWWTGASAKRKLTMRANVTGPAMRGGGALRLDDVLRFRWEIALGGDALTAEELQALAALKQPLVRFRGRWVEVNPDDVRKAAKALETANSDQATLRDVIHMALGAGPEPEGFEFGGVKARGAVAKVLRRIEGRATLDMLSPPACFQGSLRPYQARGYSWLGFLRELGLGACLADDMGLGKTVQTLALIQRDWETGDHRPVLLVCPTSVMTNWVRESARFTPDLSLLVHHGADRLQGAAFRKRADEHAIVVTSYGLLRRDAQRLQSVAWKGVVLDEAQNVKNATTQAARAAAELRSDYRIALTGTPVENNVGDLWSLMRFLNPDLLGSQADFQKRYFIPIQAKHDHAAAERLKRLTQPFVLRRLKTDPTVAPDLPEKIELDEFCSLTEEQASLYAAVVAETEEALDSADGIERKGLILATLSKLKQVCNHPAQLLKDGSALAGRSGKLARLTEMLEEILEVGDRVLVFTQFAEMGRMLQSHLQAAFGREVLFLHGGASRAQRDRMIERFQNEEHGPHVFILSLKAGGTGLNLMRANHVIHFDRWWNPAVENQATDRAFRIGQTRGVQVRKFVCVGTVEERIRDMIEAKKAITEATVGAGEAWLTELTNEELRGVFALRRETAVG